MEGLKPALAFHATCNFYTSVRLIAYTKNSFSRGESAKFSSSAPELSNIHADSLIDYCELRFDENFAASNSAYLVPSHDGVKNYKSHVAAIMYV